MPEPGNENDILEPENLAPGSKNWTPGRSASERPTREDLTEKIHTGTYERSLARAEGKTR